MRKIWAAIAAAALLALGLAAPAAASGWAADHHTRPASQPLLAVRHTPTSPKTAVQAAKTATLTGCTSTAYPSTSFGGWTWRTTYRTCPSLGDEQVASSCVYVDRYNPAAVPSAVLVTDWTCLYSRLR